MAKEALKQTQARSSKTKHNYERRTIKPISMEIGETVEGRLLDIQPGTLSKVLVIKPDSGEILRIWSSTVLDNAINERDIGKFVLITYKEDVKSSSGRMVKDYDVQVESID